MFLEIADERRYRIYKNINVQQVHNKYEENVRCTRKRPALLRLQLHGAIYRPDSFVLMLRYCANLKVIRYELTSLNRIIADKSHCVIVA